MKNQINYRLARKSDIGQLVSLMNAQYARKKTAAYFEWQFFSSPLPAYLAIAEIDNKIIGMFGIQTKILSNNLKIGQLIDLLISPPYRGKGIFDRLADTAIKYCEGIRALTVFPNRHGKIACENKLGMKAIAKIDSLFYSADALTASLIKEKTPEDMADICTDDLITFSKDQSWYRWRFDSSPEYEYKKNELDKKNFTVTKIYTDPQTKNKYGDIVVYETESHNAEKFEKLIRMTIDNFTKENITNITTWAMPHTPYYGVFKKFGFKPDLQERYFCLKILDDKFNYLYNIDKWHLSQSDAEIY